MATWAELEDEAPALAAFGARRLGVPPAYLATVRPDGRPRVHPVTPIIAGGRLFVFMEPTSPKGHDLRGRPAYALHNSVPDMHGSGGEFYVSGTAEPREDQASRAVAVAAAGYQPEDRYVLFELHLGEARCNGYGDLPLPRPGRWTAAT